MSQGVRKGNKISEPTDTTGLTPPTRIDEQRNERRAQQINHLHQEFFDLKKKIKEIESKNERIIDRIHTAYNFKKKNAYTEELIHGEEESQGNEYDNRYDVGFSGALSVDTHSNKSDHSGREIKLQKRSSELPSRKIAKSQKINLSVEYGKGYINMDEENQMRQAQTQMRFMPNQLPPTYPQQNPSLTSVGSHNRTEKRLVDELSREKKMLEEELNEKEEEVFKLQSSLKTNLRTVKGMLKQSLEEFEEEVIQRNIGLMEKALKKYEQKLKGVKTIAIKVKDRQEDKRSSRLLEYGRQRRSQSKSRKSSPPRETSYYARESKVSLSSDLRDENKSQSKINFDQQEKNRKEFQEIANRYEEIIKSKSEEIEKYDKKYKAKEREYYEMKMRMEVIQKRLGEYEAGDRKFNSSGFDNDIPAKKNMIEAEHLGSSNSNVDIGLMEEEIEKLEGKIKELNLISNEKSTQISTLQNALILNENKIKNIQNDFEQNVNKMKTKYQQEEEKYTKELQKLLNDKNTELATLKDMLIIADKKLLDKECQFYGLESKAKKMQGLLSSQETKIEELEKLVGENAPTDRSLMFSSTVMGEQTNTEAIKKLKEEIESLEVKIEESKTEIFSLTKKVNFFKCQSEELELRNSSLQKEVESLQIEMEQFKLNANINNISAVMKDHNDEEDYENDDVADSLSAIEANQKKQMFADIEGLTQNISELGKEKEEWYEKYQKIKSQNLEKESENIKLRSELGFTQKQSQDITINVNKLKEENEKLRKENKELHIQCDSLEQTLQQERDEFKIQFSEIERKWAEFEDDMMRKSGFNEGNKSEKSSVLSYGMGRSNFQVMNTQNEFLTLKLKETEAEVETLKTMEKKIIQEYQQMLEEYKIDARNKAEENREYKEEIEILSNKISTLNMRLEVSKNENGSSSKKEQKNQLIERIEELEAELKESKEINNKLTDMEGQLFEQIRIKEEENNELYQELKSKETKINELEEVIDVRAEPINTYANHMSQSAHKRESIQSQSSLKYSSHSQILRKSRMMNSSKIGVANEERGFDLELSEAGSEFYEQPSQISNISEFFDKEEHPYERMKIKRHDQIKLFEKTASYIKSLKKAIDEKNKKLKLLEKKIESLKSSELVRKEIGLDIDIKEDRFISLHERLEADDTFRDYESVQLEYKRGGGYLRKYRQLEHDTKLVMEENNLLIQQIETLEEELLKAEEQETSLVKIKDLYKEEIKKLIKKNEEQTKQFEEELKSEKKRVEESESVHNIEAIKQLFAKIIQIAGFKFTEDNAGSKKKEEKRKELEEYVKVMSNILKLDKKTKESLLATIHK